MTISAHPTRTGIDLSWVDADVRPQDDLFGHVNGRWLATHEIPADRARTAPSVHAARRPRPTSARSSRSAADSAAADDLDARAHRRPLRRVHGRERVEALGRHAAAPAARRDRRRARPAALAAVLGRRQRAGRASLVSSYVDRRADSTRYLVNLSQGGLGLPDESYYREDTFAEIREAYVAHVAGSPSWSACPTPRGRRRR